MRIHPTVPGLALLVSCAVVAMLNTGALRTAVALLGLTASSWLFWRAYSPDRFFHEDPV